MDKNEFELKIDDVFSVINCIKIASDTEKFQEWIKRTYKLKDNKTAFKGYRFFLESTIRLLMYMLITNESLGIKSDWVFYRANHRGIKLSKVPNTCEKTVLIRNLNSKLKTVRKAENYQELQIALNEFKSKILSIFDKIYTKYIDTSPDIKLNKEEALEYATMFCIMIFLNDTSKGHPHGYWVSVLDNRVEPKEMDNNFEGYKYALQFVWHSLLRRKYNLTSIKNLHKSKLWSISFEDRAKMKYKYKIGTTLDDYFGKINDEIIQPLQKKLKVNSIGFTNLLCVTKPIPKNILKNLFKGNKGPKLNEKEVFDFKLMWYDTWLSDSSRKDIFTGVSTFVYLLIGIAETKRRFDLEKAYICKFTHPNKSIGGNDYTYGVLIESFGSAGSDFSGWALFFDCCGDYSGFSGSEHYHAEKTIELYKNQGLVEVREMTIDIEKFKNYIKDKLISPCNLDNEIKTRKESNIANEARGLILELMAYYTLSKIKHEKDLLEWNVKKNGTELDLLFETEKDVMFIECKVDPHNCKLEEEINKLKNKRDNYNTNKNKVMKFWFWIEPNPRILKKLKEKRINYEILSEIVKNDPLWRNKKLNKIKFVMNQNCRFQDIFNF